MCGLGKVRDVPAGAGDEDGGGSGVMGGCGCLVFTNGGGGCDVRGLAVRLVGGSHVDFYMRCVCGICFLSHEGVAAVLKKVKCSHRGEHCGSEH